MSVIMYAYKVKRRELWNVVDTIRKYYTENHVLSNLQFDETLDDETKYNAAMQILKENRGHGAELQLFELDDKNYLFRILERNYFFIDGFKKNDWPIESVWYDESANLVAFQEKKNLEVAQWLDEKVENQRFFIVPIMTIDNLQKHYFNKYMVGKYARAI